MEMAALENIIVIIFRYEYPIEECWFLSIHNPDLT